MSASAPLDVPSASISPSGGVRNSCGVPGLKFSVKSELRYPIIQAIRSQWESQDLPALGNQYHVTDDTASQEQGYNVCALNQG